MALKQYQTVVSFLLVVFAFQCDGTSSTVSPPSYFIMAPQNKTVLEGHPVILRCKMTDVVQKCQWFYLQHGMNLFDESFQPILVKEFMPSQSRDCSIKLKQARLVQSGQWICKGLQIHAFKYVVSPPAFLTVIGPESEYTTQRTPEGRTGSGIQFRNTGEGYIVNTNLGEAALVSCYANQELSSCSWIKPDGLTVHSGENGDYRQVGNITEGNCSILISKVSSKDEGNWRCVVSGVNSDGEKVGPVVHLHIHELGEHAEGIERFFSDGNKTSSLPMILGITSFLLLAVIIALVFFIYKRMWRWNCYDHKYISSGGSQKSDYSNYEVSWHPEMRNRDQSLLEGQSCRSSNASDHFQRAGYLDMTGRSSMASRTTLSTLPIGYDMRDPHIRSSMNDKSHLNARSTPADINLIQGRKLPEITTQNDDDHLYEEIKYAHSGSVDEGIDKEGYLIPSQCSSHNTLEHNIEHSTADNLTDKTKPPISKNEESNKATEDQPNEYNYLPKNSEENTTEESYDIPKETSLPVVPERIDSKETPLANYDVPVRSDKGPISTLLS